MTPDRSDQSPLTSRLDIGGDGLRVVVKDCIDVAGTVSYCGSAAFLDRAPATENADVVDAVLDAGCHIVGKAKMHELAFGMTGANATFGTPVNPAWPDRIPGGSSTGSAVAVAAGLCDFSIGTDTGGSVRQPAVCCGVFGIKPSYGRVSRAGCTPVDSSLDCVGVFAPTAPMLTKAMQAIDPGFTPVALTSAPNLVRFTAPCDPLIQTVFDRMFADLEQVTLPLLDDAFDAGMTVINAETYAAFGALLEQGAPIGPDVAARLRAGSAVTPDMLAKAEHVRTEFTAQVDQALEHCDALVSPAMPVIVPTLEDAKDPANLLPVSHYIRPFNLSGHPAITLPMPVGPDRLPSGIQIVGRKGDDANLCAIAEHLAFAFPDILTPCLQKDR